MYEYLKPHLFQRGGDSFLHNCFGEVALEEIKKAEKRLGFSFPSELRKFYQEIGSGNLRGSKDCDENYKFYNANEILPPWVVANFVEGNLWSEEDTLGMMESSYEDLEPGDIPVFEMSDSTRFLSMKPQSDNPNAIYTMATQIKIEDSFERFIYKLYHDDPGYYGDVIQAQLPKLKI